MSKKGQAKKEKKVPEAEDYDFITGWLLALPPPFSIYINGEKKNFCPLCLEAL